MNPALAVFGTSQFTPDQVLFRAEALGRSSFVSEVPADRHHSKNAMVSSGNRNVDVVMMEAGLDGSWFAPAFEGYQDFKVKGWHKS